MILFFLSNITDRLYLREYLDTNRERLTEAIERKDYPIVVTFFLVFLQLGEVISKRFKESFYIERSDKDVVILTNKERRKNLYLTGGRKPTILSLLPFVPYPLTHGAAVRIYNLTKNISFKFDFILASFSHNGLFFPYKDKLSGVYRKIYLAKNSPTRVPYLLPSQLPARFQFALSMDMLSELKYILSSQSIDLIHIEMAEMAGYCFYLHNHPLILTEHDIGPFFYGKSFYRPHMKLDGIFEPLRRINYEREIVNYFDQIVCVAKSDENILREFFPRIPLVTVETGVDTTEFFYSYNPDREDKNLVFLGHYAHYPNEDAMVYFVEEIYPLIKEKEKDTHLFIVGSRPQRRVNRYKLRDDITVTGTVSDVREYLRLGTVFVAPLRLGLGIKGKMLEAMSVGLPIVATSLAMQGINVKDGKEVLIADTPQDFAEKVTLLLSQRDLREILSLNARKFVEENFDWRIIAKKMVGIYEKFM